MKQIGILLKWSFSLSLVLLLTGVHGQEVNHQGNTDPVKKRGAKDDGEFVIGMFGYSAMKHDDGCYVPYSTAFDEQGNPTSTLNVLREDGFNVFQTYEPFEWSSIAELKSLLRLTDNNNMKIEIGTGTYFKPKLNQNNQYMGYGINTFDNCGYTYSNCDIPWFDGRWQLNLEQLYTSILQDVDLPKPIWGIHVEEEASYCHAQQSNAECVGNSGWDVVANGQQQCEFTYQDFTNVEIPPSNVQEAIGWYRSKFNDAGIYDAKYVIMEAQHGSVINDCTPNLDGHYSPQDYVHLLNKSMNDEVFFEGSYSSFPFDNWMNQHVTDLECSNTGSHYLGAFKSIDYALQYTNNVQKVIEAQPTTQTGTDQPYNYHTDHKVPNGNWLWFQAYNSIVHGAKGVWFWELHYMNLQNEHLVWDSNDPQRFNRGNFPVMYQKYVSHLASEIRYLSQNGYLNSNSQVMSSTLGNSTGLFAYQFPTIQTNDYIENTDRYTIRYSLQSNGTDEYVLIATNPYNAPVDARIDLSCLHISGIEDVAVVDFLFCLGNDMNQVTSNYYKTNRDPNHLSLNENAIDNIFQKQVNDHGFKVSFGPLDVVIIRFKISKPNAGHNNNGWERVWTNQGSGLLGGWRIRNHDRLIWGDFDGDGNDELLIYGYTNGGHDWIALLKYDGTDWQWLWSNYGSSSSILYPYHCNFVVGDFDGDGKDELLGIESALNS